MAVRWMDEYDKRVKRLPKSTYYKKQPSLPRSGVTTERDVPYSSVPWMTKFHQGEKQHAVSYSYAKDEETGKVVPVKKGKKGTKEARWAD